MRILGLDTSTSSTGYAVIDNGKIVSYGTIIPPKKADLLDRIICIEIAIKDIIKKKEIEAIAIEELAVTRNANTMKALSGLLYHLFVEFRKREYLVIPVRPSEWRSVCNIKGKRREEQKANAILRAKFVHDITANEDEADAICICEYANTLKIE